MSEVKGEVKEEVKKEVKEEVTMSPFVKPTDTIKCEVGYYLKGDGTGFMVEGADGVDSIYDAKKLTGSVKFIFKIPDQKDTNVISLRGNNNTRDESEMGIFKTFTDLEYVRLLVLLESWNLDKPCVEDSIDNLHPSFVKGMITAIRDKIGTDGIV